MKVLAYWLGDANLTDDGNEFRLENPKRDVPSVQVSGADVVVIPARPTLNAASNLHAQGTELLMRRILQVTDEGATVAVLVCTGDDAADASYISGRLLARFQIATDTKYVDTGAVCAPQFKSYLHEYGTNWGGFVSKGAAVVHPIAYAEHDPPMLAALAVSHGKGLIYFVPANIVPHGEGGLVISLAKAIEGHSRAIRTPESAPIADSYVFGQEAPVRGDREDTRRELEALDARIADYQARKDILYLRDDPLAERLPAWISTYLGFATKRNEQYVEDFWLTDADGTEAVICEAKALNQNVRREHITALVLHREERDLSDTFPSLLVANTFADATTLSAKGRQRVGQRECRKAVRDHVLILRTLDLVRLLDQLERELITRNEAWGLLTTEIGWLKVEGDRREVVKG